MILYDSLSIYILYHTYHYKIIYQYSMWQECESVLRCLPLRVALNDLSNDTAVGSSASASNGDWAEVVSSKGYHIGRNPTLNIGSYWFWCESSNGSG